MLVDTLHSGNLGAGATTTVDTVFVVNTTGTHQVMAGVVIDDPVVEADERNNVRTENWVWGVSTTVKWVYLPVIARQ